MQKKETGQRDPRLFPQPLRQQSISPAGSGCTPQGVHSCQRGLSRAALARGNSVCPCAEGQHPYQNLREHSGCPGRRLPVSQPLCSPLYHRERKLPLSQHSYPRNGCLDFSGSIMAQQDVASVLHNPAFTHKFLQKEPCTGRILPYAGFL